MTRTRTTALRATTPLAAAALAMTLTGCGGDDEDNPTARNTVTASASSASPAVGGDNTQTGLLAAGQLVLDKVPNTTVTSIETDQGGWEVQVVDASGVETQADTDAQGGSITNGPTKQDDDAQDRAEHQALVKGATLDFTDAAAAVAKAAPGQISELNLDDFQGKTVWEADVQGNAGSGSQAKVSVRIDAGTGAVISQTTAAPGGDDD